jgi:hypothetical protein
MSAVSKAQEPVSLKLEDSWTDGGAPLPAGTTVLVLKRDGDRAQSLDDLEIGRDSLRSRLLSRAKNDPQALWDSLAIRSGETQKNYTTNVLRYLLARTPQGKLYESQVKGEDSASEEFVPGFDLVDKGDMRMKSVPDSLHPVMKTAFKKVVAAATTTRLTLHEEGDPLPENTEFRVWVKEESSEKSVQDRSFLEKQPDHTSRLDSNGATKKKFGPTWHSGNILYVAARTPDGTLYETQDDTGKPIFDLVESGRMKMASVPKSARATVKAVFLSSPWRRLQGWVGWAVFGLAGLIVGLVVGLGGARWYYAPKERELKRARRKKNELKATLRQKESQSGMGTRVVSADERQQETVENIRTENEELRQELAEKKETIRRLRQKHGPSQQDVSSSPEPPSRSHTQPSPFESTAAPSPQPSQSPVREKIGDAFARWCTEKSPAMVDRYQLFGRQVESAVDDASFRRTTREKNAAGLVFDDNAQDPVEYWLVEANGQHFLLPQPTRDRFRELGECFDGANRPPNEVTSVQPALLNRQSGRFTLDDKGQIV